MHQIVYLALDAKKVGLLAATSRIDELVNSVMQNYVEETAPSDCKCDYYSIGGRWSGFAAAKKGDSGVYPASEGSFMKYEEGQRIDIDLSYQRKSRPFSEYYDFVVHNGSKGKYHVDNQEYIPVSGGLKKNLSLTAVSELKEYWKYRYYQRCIEGDKVLQNLLPNDVHVIDGEGLVAKVGSDTLTVTTKGESFGQYIKRTGIKIEEWLPSAWAYIDKEGNWHDADEIWAKNAKQLFESGENPDAVAYRVLNDNLLHYYNQLSSQDYFLIMDCHTFP